MNQKPKLRCAIYTRKSNEEGLEQEFNSLDAQRDVCEKFVQSQRGEGWVVIPEHYDDGGFTGGNTNRPALQKLLEDIKIGMIDVIVVYKIDRLSRSLLDFLQMVKLFDSQNVSFVSITQQINTSTPAGRLMINVLMSFAEYEREVTGERIRDKIAASKKKGLWMGGMPPLGYDIADRKLVINEEEAEIIRMIFEEFIRHESVTIVVSHLQRKGIKGKSWTSRRGNTREARPLHKGDVYRILNCPLYIGKISHKKTTYDGEHQPIITQETWDAVQAIMDKNSSGERRKRKRLKSNHMLRGIIFDCENHALTPSTTKNRHGRTYRYYVSTKAIKNGYGEAPLASVPATQVENMVVAQIRQMLTTPEMVFKTYQRARAQAIGIEVEDVRAAFNDFNNLWDQLFPAEQNRLVRLLIERIEVSPEGINITYLPNGLVQVCREMKHYQEAT